MQQYKINVVERLMYCTVINCWLFRRGKLDMSIIPYVHVHMRNSTEGTPINLRLGVG